MTGYDFRMTTPANFSPLPLFALIRL